MERQANKLIFGAKQAALQKHPIKMMITNPFHPTILLEQGNQARPLVEFNRGEVLMDPKTCIRKSTPELGLCSAGQALRRKPQDIKQQARRLLWGYHITALNLARGHCFHPSLQASQPGLFLWLRERARQCQRASALRIRGEFQICPF